MIPHGVKSRSPVGITIFVLLRCLDSLLQYLILAKNFGTPLLGTLPFSRPPTPAPDVCLGLFTKSLILLDMALGSTIKQIYTLLYTANEIMPVSSAVLISASQTLFNSVNSIISHTNTTLFLTPGLLLTDTWYGISLLFILSSFGYIIGIVSETISETQRKNFKDDPKNAGKLYTNGLFAFARHVNYGSNLVWRVSYAVASGGWIYGLVNVVMFAEQFLGMGVPIMDGYCARRYGIQWIEYKRRVPYKLIPGVI
ncbi:hypothetical protein L207DRAFT_549432 [Hyaloscypha variabilis F]|uniref:Delta(14)-sterol reductase n=1 Tax=Hyaloscypha variabilis (strain UAMH 11265 / GT02V1 / F) TaxID=1149755 RepID=A0A2J6QW25_HYAVF|nr:hypothetical protein L207DRAFT_549432 [Hyaloscypha variabilis F]